MTEYFKSPNGDIVSGENACPIAACVRNAITFTVLEEGRAAYTERGKLGSWAEPLQTFVVRTAYDAAYRIAKNIVGIRTAFNEADRYSHNIANAQKTDVNHKIAYNTGCRAARFAHNPHYRDSDIDHIITSGVISAVVSAAKSQNSQKKRVAAAIKAIETPKDDRIIAFEFAFAAAKKVTDDEDEAYSLAIITYDVVRLFYAFANSHFLPEDIDDTPEFLQDMNQARNQVVNESASEFVNLLFSVRDKCDVDDFSDYDYIAIKVACATAESIKTCSIFFADAIPRFGSLAKTGIVNACILFAYVSIHSIAEWFGLLRISLTANMKKDIDEKSEMKRMLCYLDERVDFYHQKKRKLPNEVTEAIKILDEIQAIQPGSDKGFRPVRQFIEKYIYWKSDDFITKVQTIPIRELIYTFVMNTAADFVESGEYHLYRGIVNDLGPGKDFVRIFNWGQDELLKMGATDEETVKRSKEAFERNLQTVG